MSFGLLEQSNPFFWIVWQQLAPPSTPYCPESHHTKDVLLFDVTLKYIYYLNLSNINKQEPIQKPSYDPTQNPTKVSVMIIRYIWEYM